MTCGYRAPDPLGTRAVRVASASGSAFAALHYSVIDYFSYIP